MVQPSMHETLMAPFTSSEMHDSLMAIDGQKCHGEDGLSRAFFTTFWNQIQQPLLAAFQQIFSSGQMPASLSSGLICLIPKGGDRQELRQWRPITLLSTAYKILAKMISARVRPFLSDLIHDTQTGFV